MTQKLGAVLFVCAAIAMGFATRTLNGQAQATQAHAAEFQQDVLPVLAKSCLGCHSEKAQAGKLNLEPLRDPATTATHTAVWQSVLEKVSAGAMPPPTAKPLTDAERAAVIGWITKLPGLTAGTTTGEAMAGRVTARRLNRVEYNNTDTRPSWRRRRGPRTNFRWTTRVTASTTTAMCCRSRRC